MKEFYPSAAPLMDVYEKNGAISPIFLASEQIILHSTPKNAKKEHNTVIRLAASIEKYGILRR